MANSSKGNSSRRKERRKGWRRDEEHTIGGKVTCWFAERTVSTILRAKKFLENNKQKSTQRKIYTGINTKYYQQELHKICRLSVTICCGRVYDKVMMPTVTKPIFLSWPTMIRGSTAALWRYYISGRDNNDKKRRWRYWMEFLETTVMMKMMVIHLPNITQLKVRPRRVTRVVREIKAFLMLVTKIKIFDTIAQWQKK